MAEMVQVQGLELLCIDGRGEITVFQSSYFNYLTTFQPSLLADVCMCPPTVVHEGPARIRALRQEAVCGTLHHVLHELYT